MESKRTTRASSQDVATRRGTRKSPGRKRSPSPIVEEGNASPASPKVKAKGRPKSASRKDEKPPAAPKSPAKVSTAAAAKSAGAKAETTPTQKKSPRGRPRKAAATTASTSSTTTTNTTKTITLSSSSSASAIVGDLKTRLRASMTPMTRSASRSMSRSVYDREFSDDDLDNTNEDRPGSASFGRRSVSRQPQDCVVRYGVIGSVALLLVMISLVLGVTISCSSTGCQPSWASLKRTLAQCSTWYDPQATAVGVLFSAAVALVSALPTGRVVSFPVDDLEDPKTYTYNGFATFVVTLAVALYTTDGLQFVYRHYMHLCVLSILTAIVVAVAAFVRSRFQPADTLNAYARTQRPLFDFVVGREVSPLWFRRIDAKLVFYRISVITTLLVNIVVLAKTVVLPPTELTLNATSVWAFVAGIRADVATTAAASMVLVYCMDLLIFEHHLTSSFDIQCEGFGALVLLRFALFPFMVSAVPKYVLENATAAPWWVIAIMAVLFTAGLVMKRYADQIKYSYRMYPMNPRFDNLDTIATFQGQGIISDSVWKIVRHPNHMGEVLIFAAFLPLLCVRFAWAPLVAVLYLISVMVHRAGRVDHRSNLKYNSAWAQYSKIVPYLLVPRVY